MFFTNSLNTIIKVENALAIYRNFSLTKDRVFKLIYVLILIIVPIPIQLLYQCDIDVLVKNTRVKYTHSYIYFTLCNSIVIVVTALTTSKQFEKLHINFVETHRLLNNCKIYQNNLVNLDKIIKILFLCLSVMCSVIVSFVWLINRTMYPDNSTLPVLLSHSIVVFSELQSKFEYITFYCCLSILSIQMESAIRILENEAQSFLEDNIPVLAECIHYCGISSSLINIIFSLQVYLYYYLQHLLLYKTIHDGHQFLLQCNLPEVLSRNRLCYL